MGSDQKEVPKTATGQYIGPRPSLPERLRAACLCPPESVVVIESDMLLMEAATSIEQYGILIKEYMADLEAAKSWRGPLRWDKMTDDDVEAYCFELAGALRRRKKHKAAKAIQAISDELYEGAIKPAPIIPRTTHG
jgi:hypothetical protein